MAAVRAALDEARSKAPERPSEPTVHVVSGEELDALFAEAGVAAAEQVRQRQPEPGMWRGTMGFVPPPDKAVAARGETDDFFAKPAHRHAFVRKEKDEAPTAPPTQPKGRRFEVPRARAKKLKP